MLYIKLLTAAIFSFSLSALAGAPANYSQLRTAIQKTSRKDVMDLVAALVSVSSPSRMVGTKGHEKANKWLLEKIREFDPKGSGKIIEGSFTPDVNVAKAFYQKDFDEMVEGKIQPHLPEYKKWKTVTEHMKSRAESLKGVHGKNIIWEKQGISSNKWLVVTAHYDTISHDPDTQLIMDKDAMPGANYNGSGVAVALSLIKLLAQTELNYSVQVVLLDWQGVGFLGSYEHAKALKSSDKKILGVVNLEMLGQDTKFFDKTKKFGNMCVFVRDNPEEVRWITALTKHGTAINKKIEFAIRPLGFANSDNIRYWDQGLMAATFTQNWEEDFNKKFFQTPQDTAETLNQDTLYNAYEYLGGAVLGTLLDITK